MSVYRMFTGDDGRSHIEDVELTPQFLSELRPTESVKFNTLPAGTVTDWHPAPRRRWLFILAGRFELVFRDGISQILDPGDVTLCEDVTGPGHLYRVLGDAPALVAVVELPDS